RFASKDGLRTKPSFASNVHELAVQRQGPNQLVEGEDRNSRAYRSHEVPARCNERIGSRLGHQELMVPKEPASSEASSQARLPSSPSFAHRWQMPVGSLQGRPSV